MKIVDIAVDNVDHGAFSAVFSDGHVNDFSTVIVNGGPRPGGTFSLVSDDMSDVAF